MFIHAHMLRQTHKLTCMQTHTQWHTRIYTHMHRESYEELRQHLDAAKDKILSLEAMLEKVSQNEFAQPKEAAESTGRRDSTGRFVPSDPPALCHEESDEAAGYPGTLVQFRCILSRTPTLAEKHPLLQKVGATQ